MGVMRISHVSLSVMDIEASINHYVNVVGMYLTHKASDGTAFLKCWDEWDKYSVVLTPSDRASLNHVAYKVENDSDLDLFERRINEYGIKTEMAPRDALPFCGRALQFRLPSGQIMYLIAEKEYVGKAVGVLNPDPWPDDRHGAGANFLDHCLLVGELNPEKGINRVVDTSEFLKATMDFSLSEKMMYGPDASVLGGAFLFRGAKPHDIAIFGSTGPGFHHLSFFLEDWNAVRHAGDIMGKNRVDVESPPNRHGVTRGETIYFFDPNGIRNETFGGLGYPSYPDMPEITWTPETAPRAYFFHTLRPLESFATVFLPCS
ncbi:catechol 2,3-dioxygenase [Hyphococcus sp.]|uniref:catechol 2,3-dioxygenase n=1 Tax=Hyphococcus sp. TaxID=2038636 RepID=UPI0035C71C66